MRIVTWNQKQDSGSSVWPLFFHTLKADIVLLQETLNPEWSGQVLWEKVPHAFWGSAILTSTGTIRPLKIPGYEGWVVGGEWLDSGLRQSGHPLYIFNIHAPTGNSNHPRRSFVKEVISILDIIERLIPGNANLILGGDFNFLSLGERKAGEPLATTRSERQALNHLHSKGLVSCWSATHPGRPLEQTLRWAGDRHSDKATPFHCDGIFVPESWTPNMVCEILTSSIFEISDHYPVTAWIK
ncbi:hypothetical protein GF406_08365 [candidate division KSB1 bacterium]|nr:hypothetical protein [candidate division KSB1 bacterium]